MIEDSWKEFSAWPEFISAMRLVLPYPEHDQDQGHDPSQWALLPGLCSQAAGGTLEATREVSAAWLLLYTAAHLVDAVEDEDPDPKIGLLGGRAVAINSANGLFLSASRILDSLQKKDLPEDLAAGIKSDYLDTILRMMGGQHLDLTIHQLDVAQWWQIAEAKSGAFFSLACRSGAKFGTRDNRKLAAYRDFGFHLGLMLQVIDDLEEFRRLLEAAEPATPNLVGKSLAIAYAGNVLPEEESYDLRSLIQGSSSTGRTAGELIDILEECGAGLYLAAELKKHSDLAEASLKTARPEPEAGEKLEMLIRAFKVN